MDILLEACGQGDGQLSYSTCPTLILLPWGQSPPFLSEIHSVSLLASLRLTAGCLADQSTRWHSDWSSGGHVLDSRPIRGKPGLLGEPPGENCGFFLVPAEPAERAPGTVSGSLSASLGAEPV